MKIRAALYNANHLEYGLVTIPFPIPPDQYDSTIGMLETMDIGDPQVRDCVADEIQSPIPALKCLEGSKVNVDELDYLTKRLDSFADSELAQFQGMVYKLGTSDMTDLINLTFCCQQATVITDFSDLEQIGRDHYLNLHGGCASVEELKQLDGTETAMLLISEHRGTITPYASKQELEQAILRKHPPMDVQPDEAPAPQPGPADPPKGADLDRARKELGQLRPVNRHLKNMEDSEGDSP